MWEVNHCINVKFSTSVERTERVVEVSNAFGLELSGREFVIYDDLKFTVKNGHRVYITGQSGSGKSIILRKMEEEYKEAGIRAVNIDSVELTEEPIIDQVGGSTDEATKILQIAGIGDAYLLLRKPSELSDGQRYRLKVAKLLCNNEADVWLCDEFGAVLDRKTAKFLAYSVSKIAESRGIAVVIATTHKDLMTDFRPHLIIEKHYAHEVAMKHIDEEWYERY